MLRRLSDWLAAQACSQNKQATKQQALLVLAVDGVVWIRAACLMYTHSHGVLDAQRGVVDCGELSLAEGSLSFR